jgi:transcriptional regulator with XRE-family HTH domain
MAREAEAIGARMRELREGMDLTQREFAHRLPGKTEGKDVSRWENGKHRPSPDTLGHIADALGTTVADLHAGPLAERKTRGPTPDPFATSRGEAESLADLSRQVASLRSELIAEMAVLRTAVEGLRTPQMRDGHG